jgi:formate hydrogenlyase subunit 6/NADH:ubiquinone oxidoreductase subunit I
MMEEDRRTPERKGPEAMCAQKMPEIDVELCTACGDCIEACPEEALSLSAAHKVLLDEERCAYCGDCEDICPVGAIAVPFEVVLSKTVRRDENGNA